LNRGFLTDYRIARIIKKNRKIRNSDNVRNEIKLTKLHHHNTNFKMKDFKIDFLDHIAIRVKDLDASAAWYEKVFGFTRNQFDEWGEYPIFMMAGKTGIALFPANMDDPELNPASKNIKIDHFAFNVTRENMELAKQRLTQLNIKFVMKNHHYFESIYMDDPDGHCVELTTILVSEKEFYKPY